MMTAVLADRPYTVEEIPVNELLVDPRVQREHFKPLKVEKIFRNYNPSALGIITVSRRKDRGMYILDGWHRVEAYRRLTDNAGTVPCHVFEGLTLEEEAAVFLDSNFRETPNIMDRFKVQLTKGDPKSLEIDRLTKQYDWTVSATPANGNINAIGALGRMYDLSEKLELEPHLIQIVLITITRAWGHERQGAQSVLLEGLGRLWAEHGEKINLDRLVETLRDFPDGPYGLHQAASSVSRSRGLKLPMAVADIVTERYNRGYSNNSRNRLPIWRLR